ncbi:hypothetical protein J1N35_040723 [Gossypium stocksii]|uniref:Uncharacterized protein n=1 Tax=Gossypium stocksii TaxID=47602 RepID=A0A9D3ZHZ7_9ROSI|nr:hypothetical protein J1N35_040723 [Gossypium stocksii]
MDRNQELVFSFSSIVEFEDMQQAALFVVREALLHAERRGLTVGIFKENIKILGQVLEGKTNIINWKIKTLVEDIRRLGNSGNKEATELVMANGVVDNGCSLVRRIRAMLKLQWEMYIRHITRESNKALKAANFVAKAFRKRGVALRC